MYVDPPRIKVTLPWWTCVIGGTTFFLLALKYVTWDGYVTVPLRWHGLSLTLYFFVRPRIHPELSLALHYPPCYVPTNWA